MPLTSTCQYDFWQVYIIIWQLDIIFRQVDIMIWQVNIITYFCLFKLWCWLVRCCVNVSDNDVYLSNLCQLVRCYLNLSDNFVVICLTLIGQDYIFKIYFWFSLQMNKWQVNIKIWQGNKKIWQDDLKIWQVNIIIWQVMAEICHLKNQCELLQRYRKLISRGFNFYLKEYVLGCNEFVSSEKISYTGYIQARNASVLFCNNSIKRNFVYTGIFFISNNNLVL